MPMYTFLIVFQILLLKEIHERAVPFIRRLRSLKPGVPIILVESIFREKGNWNSVKGNYVNNQNREFRQAYDQLIGREFQTTLLCSQ